MKTMLQTLRRFEYPNEQIALLFQAKSGTFGVNFLTPIIFVLIYSPYIPGVYLLVWLSLQIALFFVRVQIAQKGLQAIERSEQQAIDRYFRFYLWMIFSNALLWGSVSVLVHHYTGQTMSFMYVIILFGLTAAGSSTLGVVFHAIVIFLTNTLIVGSLVSLYYSTIPIDYVLSLLMWVYFFFMLKVGYRNHLFIATNVAQKEQITKSHNVIKASIEYAALIQKAMLPKETMLDRYFEDYFVSIKQRDIVGGDFYSVVPLGQGKLLVMVLDGVGHGVSGAFMTMLLKATEQKILTEIHQQSLEPRPALILSRFNVLIKTMTQDQADTQAIIGFDGGVLCIDQERSLAQYAGARLPLYTVTQGELRCYKGDRKGIGFVRTPIKQSFTEHTISLTSDSVFYLTTDGMMDQENTQGQRFGEQRFEAFVLAHYHQPFGEQYAALEAEIERFAKGNAPLDDRTVLGFSLKR